MRNTKQTLKIALARIMSYVFPTGLQLPLKFWSSVLGDDGCEPELKYLDRICKSGEVALDIGANIGLYSYALSKRFKKVYSFEVNTEVTKDLERLSAPNIQIVHCGLSSKSIETIFYVPIASGMEMPGWGSLDPTNCPDASSLRTLSVSLRSLDSFNISGDEACLATLNQRCVIY